MTGIQPELWVAGARAAVAFYQAAFDALVLHSVGDGDDIVAQLAVGGAAFWVSEANPEMGRLSPRAIGGTTSRTLLVVDDPDTVFDQALAAGATEIAPVSQEHGWRIGRIADPFGHEWEIGRPLGHWPAHDIAAR
jgi:PhnB protein